MWLLVLDPVSELDRVEVLENVALGVKDDVVLSENVPVLDAEAVLVKDMLQDTDRDMDWLNVREEAVSEAVLERVPVKLREDVSVPVDVLLRLKEAVAVDVKEGVSDLEEDGEEVEEKEVERLRLHVRLGVTVLEGLEEPETEEEAERLLLKLFE